MKTFEIQGDDVDKITEPFKACRNVWLMTTTVPRSDDSKRP